jgi:hypothetical protein
MVGHPALAHLSRLSVPGQRTETWWRIWNIRAKHSLPSDGSRL